MTLKVTILGCGSSGGVPRSDGNFGVCDENEPKNYRTRCSILVEKFYSNNEKTTVLIDTSPDLRQQTLAAKVKSIDAILYSHDHADQTHGIDDIRPFVYSNRKLIPTYFNQATADSLISRFSYIFKGYEKQNYPPLLIPNIFPNYGEIISIKGDGGSIDFMPIKLIHGDIECAGFRFGDIAYCNDVNEIPTESLEELKNLDVLIIDCLRFIKHPTHAHFDKTMEWVDLLKPKKTILTNMHIDMDYNHLISILPPNVLPAYDQMVVVYE